MFNIDVCQEFFLSYEMSDFAEKQSFQNYIRILFCISNVARRLLMTHIHTSSRTSNSKACFFTIYYGKFMDLIFKLSYAITLSVKLVKETEINLSWFGSSYVVFDVVLEPDQTMRARLTAVIF